MIHTLPETIQWLIHNPFQDMDIEKGLTVVNKYVLNDAVNYLKDYQEMLANIENEPLDWDELMLMDGKPIWIEGSSVLAHWMIIADIRPDCLTCRGMLICRGRFGENVPFYKEDLGRTWLAYKKERMKRDNEHITSVYDK